MNSKGTFWEQDTEGGVAEGGKGKGGNEEALVRVLRELSTVQRNLANLQVELQGRQVRIPRVTVLHSSLVHPAVLLGRITKRQRVQSMANSGLKTKFLCTE